MSHARRMMLPMDITTPTKVICVDGRPLAWLMPDGRIYPHVSGADDGEGGDSGGGSGDGGGGDGSGEGGDGNPPNNKNEDGDGEAKVEMTQAEFDEKIKQRLGRAKTQWEKEAKEAAERDQLDEADRLKAEKADAEKAAKDATDRANDRLVRASAKVAAVDAGANPKRVDALLKLADLSDIEVDDDGEPDGEAVTKAVTKALGEYPEFKAAAGKGGPSGGEHNGDSTKKASNLQEAVAGALAG